MRAVRQGQAGWLQYELEYSIASTVETVWRALLEETQLWWLPDFHMLGPDSVVTFDPRAGGEGLVEKGPGGGSLLWYSVQMHASELHQIWLVGHIAPDYGGPATSMLKLAADSDGAGGCRLRLTDALLGNVSETMMRSLQEGWSQLFGIGLRRHVESGIPS